LAWPCEHAERIEEPNDPAQSGLAVSTDGSAWTKDNFDSALNRIRKRAGLPNFGWHALRHAFASHLVMQGVPLKAVQELLGHTDIRLTMRSAHLAPSATRDAVAVLDRLPYGNLAATGHGGDVVIFAQRGSKRNRIQNGRGDRI